MSKTWTTYNGTEAITWQLVRGIARAVKVERDHYALPATDAIGTDCPTCSAADGRPCVSVAGKTLSRPHRARDAFVATPPECESCSNPAASFNAKYCKECRVERDRLLSRMRDRSVRGSCVDCGADIARKSTRCKPCAATVAYAQRKAS